MQHLLQPKSAESILQTTDTVERCDVREYEQFPQDGGRRRQDRCHTCIGTVASAEPLPLELTHYEELCASQDAVV